MKFNLVLPDKNNYEYKGLSANKSKFIWQDLATSIVEIHSTIVNPFDKKVCCFFALDKGQTRESRKIGGTKYLKRLILKVSDFDNKLEKACLIREVVKGQFAYSNEKTIAFAAFNGEFRNYWIYYKIFQSSNLKLYRTK